MKKLTIITIFFFTIFFSYTIIAQQMRAFRSNYNINFPKKIMNPMGDPLPTGTYTIGTSGDFPTIDSAFNKLSIDGISGSVTLELTDTLYTAPYTVPADSVGFFLNGPIPGADQNNKVIIKPATNKNVIIEGSGSAILTCLNTSYVTIDGVALTGSTSLTFHALYNNQFIWNDCLDFLDNSNYNLIQNITFISEDYNRASAGLAFYTPWNVGISAPDSNFIKNNFVKKVGYGIIIQGSINTRVIGNIIKGNIIGSASDSLISVGIHLMKSQNSIVENNIVQNLKVSGIYPADDLVMGINSYWGAGDIIRNNVVHNIKNSTGYTSTGILLSGGINPNEIGNNNLIYNNMVYDIQSSSAQNDNRVAGIQMWYQNNPKVYFNSVYLTGKGSSLSGSADIYIHNTCSNVETKNNILVNTRGESHYYASAIYNYTTSNFVSDYNDLYNGPNQNNCLVRIGNTKYNNLTDWQAKEKDLHSVSEMPNFIAPYLHIDETIPTNLEKRAAVITDIDADFDGDLRGTNLPDIGADEFDGKVAPGPLTGAYSIGTTGYFPTIDSVFKRLSTAGISAPVTLELTDTLYTAPTDSFGFFLNGPIPGANLDNRVIIRPEANKNVTIKGSGESVLRFLNTSYLTLDGVSLNGASTLTVYALSNENFIINDAVDFLSNSDHNIVQNITAITEDYNRFSLGIGFWVTDINANTAPDSNIIQNNFIKKAGYAGILISCLKLNGTSNKEAIGNVISGNFVGSETDSLITWGIQVEHGKNTIIEKNEVQNIRRLINESYVVIIFGINCYGSNGSIIRGNIVHNIYDNGSRSGATGILLSGDFGETGSNNIIYNNMVYDIRSSSKNSQSCATGIHMWQQNNPKIYYNTVYLNGKGSSPLGSSALYVENPCTNVEVKNNILANTRDESPYCSSSLFADSYSITSSDNNDLYYDPSQYNCLVKIGSTNYNTLTDWQKNNIDLNSITEIPHFKEGSLHIDGSIPTNLESHGVPIAGIDVDIDGDARGTDSTDIGADEFKGTTIVAVNDKVTRPLVFNLEQNYPNPFNPTTTIKYSIPKQSYVILKVYDILGRKVATLVNEEKQAGNYEIEFQGQQTTNNKQLSSGVYFYQIKAGDYVSTKKMILLK